MKRNHLRVLAAWSACVFASAVASAAPPNPTSTRTVQRAPSIIDNTAHMDANNLDMVVTNHGSFAWDIVTGNAGLIYPKGSTKTAVFAAGPWIGAKVGWLGSLRVAVSEYSQEFVPGPMLDGTFQPDQPTFKTYKIVRGNTTSPDYLNWPASQGAPLGQDGKPLLLGDATMWSVYNDADPSLHTAGPGTTAPLGIEIQQTTFAFNRAGPLGNMIFFIFKLINKGPDFFQDAYFSFWSDPDLGGSTDDLVGCDTTLSMGYCYNATNADAVYGSQPPAVGYRLLRGPVVPVSPGVFDTLGMSSFIKYINGTDPVNSVESYNFMRGLHSDGTEIHFGDDPALPTTTYEVSGDPISGTGWLDSNPADRRLALSSGPFFMYPGETQEIAAAILVGQGTDRLASLSDLTNAARVARETYRRLFVHEEPLLVRIFRTRTNKIQLYTDGEHHCFQIEPIGGDFALSDVNPSTIVMKYGAAQVPAETGKAVVIGDTDHNGIAEIQTCFSAAALRTLFVAAPIGVSTVTVSLEGDLTTGARFRGEIQLRIQKDDNQENASVSPNPFNPDATLTFFVTKPGLVRVKMYDLEGRLIRTLMEEVAAAGHHELAIDGLGAGGDRLASGVYFYRVETVAGVTTGRFVIMK